ncbi:MAG: YmfQ family protein [Treponema sp.]|jgi:uncharacterized protein YmfQ (DUF2313 family)|nr:YmfQ family protein [Treponema sp.]
MGIKIASETDYSTAIRDLFPKGEYWEKQFSDPKSDVNLFCKAKTQEIIRLRKRMCNLLEESNYKTAVETISDWERIMLGYTNAHLPLEKRREILSTNNVQIINRIVIADIAKTFGFIITNIQFPYRPAFFGFSRFGIDSIATPASWQTIVLHSLTQGNDAQISVFETHINNVLTNYTPYFLYNGGNS